MPIVTTVVLLVSQVRISILMFATQTVIFAVLCEFPHIITLIIATLTVTDVGMFVSLPIFTTMLVIRIVMYATIIVWYNLTSMSTNVTVIVMCVTVFELCLIIMRMVVTMSVTVAGLFVK